MAKAAQIPGIECDGPASDNIRRVLTVRLEEMCSMRDRALDWDDPEGVHDMRVASRRLRGAVRDFLPYLRKRPLTKSLNEIKDVARNLGRVRDLEVAILELEKIAQKAGPAEAAGLRKIASLRQVRLEEARASLKGGLEGSSLQQLRDDFLKGLEAATAPKRQRQTEPPAAAIATGETYRQVARAVILRRLEEFEELGEGFRRPFKVKPLHNLRIGAKYLRYALELFWQCW